jgi:hypothetical protein
MCTQTASLFSAGDCSVLAGGKTVPLTTTCAATNVKNTAMVAYKAVSTGTGCAPVGFNPATTGSVAFTAPETVCCK